MSDKSQKILFLGCGKMGGALLRSLIRNGVDSSQINVIDPFVKEKIPVVEYFSNVSDLHHDYQADVVFFAIKPQDASEVLPIFFKENKFHKKTIFISILAGKKIKFFLEIFGTKMKLVRTMPNLAVVENQGIISYITKNLSPKEKIKIEKTLALFGEIIELKNEKSFDNFTAIFGSGPAYIFYLQEIFLEIAKSCDVNEDKARHLVKKLFLGSSILSNNSDLDFYKLRESVASKKGTTEAALEVLMKKDIIKNVFKKAIKAGAKRSKTLNTTSHLK